MNRLIIGTQNKAKIEQIKESLFGLNVYIEGLGCEIDIKEDAKTPQGNARLKAIAYSKFLNDIVLSMDNALYFDDLTDEEQPGVNVRRIPNRKERPSDEELLKYYISIIERFGGKVSGKWEFAICVANNGNVIGETTIISPRIFVSNPSPVFLEGYPLDSLYIVPKYGGKYLSELSKEERKQYRLETLGKPMSKFVESVL